jgi:hypothetical protein
VSLGVFNVDEACRRWNVQISKSPAETVRDVVETVFVDKAVPVTAVPAGVGAMIYPMGNPANPDDRHTIALLVWRMGLTLDLLYTQRQLGEIVQSPIRNNPGLETSADSTQGYRQ